MPKEELSAVRNGDKLIDIHIVGAQNLIQAEFPELDGFQSPLLSQVDGLTPIISSAVQIHHVKDCDHWVTSCLVGKCQYTTAPSTESCQ